MLVVSWTVVVIAIAAVLALVGLVAWQMRRRRQPQPLPTEWAVTPRPVFSTDERRVYRLLREALPHHVVLAKLPLVRFCQPSEPANVRYWYDLLGTHYVAFAVCSTNGRVLAAIDLDSDRSSSRRALQIKQSVLSACRVRYLRCPAEQLPTVAELQLLVPQPNGAARGPQAAPATPPHRLHEARTNLASAVAHRRAERTALWQDSTLFQDSFFAPDSRLEGGNSEFGAFGGVPTTRHAVDDADGSEIAGVVIDPPAPPSSR